MLDVTQTPVAVFWAAFAPFQIVFKQTQALTGRSLHSHMYACIYSHLNLV